MFRNAKVLQFLISGFMAALLLVAMGCDQDNNSNPKGATNAATNQGAPTTGNPLESVANAAEPPTPPAEATPTITEEEAQAQEAAKARAIAAQKAQEAAKDPCRQLVCSTDDEPWRGCYYAAALYRDAPGTVPGVRHITSIMRPDQIVWYRGALLASYRRDLWYSTDYRMGDPADLNQSARDVRLGILGDKDTADAMSEGVVCGYLGSTDITLADIIAASRANSPFVAKKRPAKAADVKLEILEDLLAPAQPAETGCGADPCPPPSDAPATPDCGGATPCPPPPSGVGPAPDPAATTPAAPAFDPAAVPPATDPVPAEPPADAPATPPAMDPAVPSEPGGAAPTPPSGEGTLTRNFFSGQGFGGKPSRPFRHEVRF